MTESQQTFTNGTVTISEEVIAMIAGTAAQEVDGITPADISDAKTRRNIGKTVKISIDGGKIYAALGLAVKQGARIADVTREAQQKVKAAIENMTGIIVAAVDISVIGLGGGTSMRGKA
ncbi:MAG: Asp23/Gls24 family envelope stress response protein [Defluviitaleaceae bacterium]|nr:Asp23/Gls24 family envelope stress response protein [Defluviitaleaceae bacterium]